MHEQLPPPIDASMIPALDCSALGDPRAVSPSTSPMSQRTRSIDSCSSKSTKPSSREGSPVVQTPSRRRKSHGSGRSNSWQESPSSNLIFCPRPYEEIYTERAYLTKLLQMHSLKATELINQYSLAEGELQSEGCTGKPKRKLKKQLNLLKRKISDASQQEKALIVRLTELHMELQSRETWDRVRQRRTSEVSECSTILERPTTSSSCSSISRTQLNAASQEFVPSGSAFIVQLAYPQYTVQQTEVVAGLETVEEKYEEETEDSSEGESGNDGESDELCNHGLEYTYQVPEEDMPPLEEASYHDAKPKTCREVKRLSLPSLCSIWPGA